MASFKEQEDIRIPVKVSFIRNYYETYSDCPMDEKGGIVNQICHMMNYHQHKTVTNVILGVKDALDNDEDYNVECKKYFNEARRKIQQGSYEDHLLTTFLEKGNSCLSSTQVFNASICAPSNLPRMGVIAIYNAIKRTELFRPPIGSFRMLVDLWRILHL